MPLNPETYRLPLHELFTALRTHDFPLGVDDYLLLIEAMEKGLGLADLADLHQLCEHLWLKPTQSRSLFRDLFDRFVQAEQARALRASQATELPLPEPPPFVEEEAPIGSPFEPSRPHTPEEPIPPLSPLPLANQELKLSVSSSLENALGLSLDQAEEQAAILSEQTFFFQGSYQPIPARSLSLGWRNFRHTTHTRKRHDIDLPKTMAHLMRTGRLDQLFFQEDPVKQSALLLLMDWGGSMLAFHPFLRQLAESTSTTSQGLAQQLYFHDVPGPNLFTEPQQLTAHPLSLLQRHWSQQSLSVLIVSDAGAARGTYDRQRVIQTAEALKSLRTFDRHLAWLNPVPQTRWQGSSAQYIRQLIPMFEANTIGWQHCLEVLRGKQFPVR